MANYLSELLDNDVTDVIYNKLHHILMKDLITEIHNKHTIFESAIVNDQDPLEELRKHYNIELYIDNDIYGYISVIMIDSNQFMLFYDYDQLLVHGFIENNYIKIERIYYEEDNQKYQSLEKQLPNPSPFLFIEEIFNCAPDTLQIDYTYTSGKYWKNIDGICDWFNYYFISDLI
jgi:hypothetical protein